MVSKNRDAMPPTVGPGSLAEQRHPQEKLVAVVDDDVGFVEMLQLALLDAGYRVTTSTPRDAWAKIEADRPQIILLDLWRGNPPAGWTLLQRLASELRPPIPILVMSTDVGSIREHFARLGLASGPLDDSDALLDVMEKPFDLDDLLRRIERMTEGA